VQINRTGAGGLLVAVATVSAGFAFVGNAASLPLWIIAGVTFVPGAVLSLKSDAAASGGSTPQKNGDPVSAKGVKNLQPSEPVAKTVDADSKAGRRYLNHSPEDIVALYDGKTAVQGNAAFSLYRGQWMQVDGTVFDVGPRPSGRGVNLTRPGRRIIVLAVFPDSSFWPDLDVLEVGELIRVEGRLTSADQLGITLDDCQLSVEPPSISERGEVSE